MSRLQAGRAAALLGWACAGAGCAGGEPTPVAFEIAPAPAERTLEEMLSSDAFRPLEGTSHNAGFTRSAFWVRFRLPAGGGPGAEWLLEVKDQPDRVELYAPRPAGAGYDRRITGRLEPARTRDIRHGDPVLRLAAPVDPSAAFYLRLTSGAPLIVRPLCWSPGALAEAALTRGLWLGAYYGVLLVSLLYNLFIHFSVRERAYLSYAVFVAGLGLAVASIDHLTFVYWWPESPVWAARSILVFGGAASAAGIAFCRSFLETRRIAPRFDRWLAVLAVWCGAVAGVGLVTEAMPVKMAMLCAANAMFPSVWIAGWLAWRARAPGGRYLLIAWSLFLLGGSLRALVQMGVLPMHPVTEHAWRFGTVAEVTLLSLALGARMRRLQQENAVAQQALLETRRAQAETLEAEVACRTRDLAQALEGLKSAQTQLVHQARMASLGRLVQGVAHEVGNPLNFLCGGVAELGRRLEGHPDPAAHRALGLAQLGSQRLREVVESLRAYVRGDREATPWEVDAGVRTTVELCRGRIDDQGVELALDLGGVPPVRGMGGELGQLLTNLVVNALDAMPRGGRLAVRTSVAGAGVAIEVADTGPGVPAEHRERIFEPWFSTKTGSASTGLGLSISHEIVDRHRGTLVLLPTTPGATFRVWLPWGDDECRGVSKVDVPADLMKDVDNPGIS